MDRQPGIMPTTIEALADAVYPSFAMLAGMELDLFTPLKDGPLAAEAIASRRHSRPVRPVPVRCSTRKAYDGAGQEHDRPSG